MNGRFWHILIIDDDEEEFLLIDEALKSIPNQAIRSDWVCSAQKAYAAIQNPLYSVILLDYHLGSENGLSILQHTVANGNSHAPIIMITGQDDIKTDQRAMQAGADDFLPKSQLTAIQLERTIRYAIERHESRRQLQQMQATLAQRVTDLNKTTIQLKREITKNQKVQAKLIAQTQQLQEKNKELDQFASIISHDLKEPLRMITGYLTLLVNKSKEELSPTSQLYVQHAVEGAERMRQLIKAMLVYSRLTSRSHAFTPTNLNEVLETVKANLQFQLAESNGRILAPPLPTIPADPTQMVQLFQNLIANAIKFRSDKPLQINITATAQPQQWLFTLTDNGIGIESKHAKEIFLIFRRLHTRSEYEGTGIGLAICHKIVERHGGKLWLNTAVSDGASFKFTLPLKQNPAHPA